MEFLSRNDINIIIIMYRLSQMLLFYSKSIVIAIKFENQNRTFDFAESLVRLLHRFFFDYVFAPHSFYLSH